MCNGRSPSGRCCRPGLANARASEYVGPYSRARGVDDEDHCVAAVAWSLTWKRSMTRAESELRQHLAEDGGAGVANAVDVGRADRALRIQRTDPLVEDPPGRVSAHDGQLEYPVAVWCQTGRLNIDDRVAEPSPVAA